MADYFRTARHLHTIAPAVALALMVPAAPAAAKTVVVADLDPPAGAETSAIAVHRAGTAAPRERLENGVILLLGGLPLDADDRDGEAAEPAPRPVAVPAIVRERQAFGVTILIAGSRDPGLAATEIEAPEDPGPRAVALTDFLLDVDGNPFRRFRGYCDVIDAEDDEARLQFIGTVPSSLSFEAKATSCVLTLQPVPNMDYTVTQWADDEIVAAAGVRGPGGREVRIRSDGPWGARRGCTLRTITGGQRLGGQRVAGCFFDNQITHTTGFVDYDLQRIHGPGFDDSGTAITHRAGFSDARSQSVNPVGFVDISLLRTHAAGGVPLLKNPRCWVDADSGSVPVDC